MDYLYCPSFYQLSIIDVWNKHKQKNEPMYILRKEVKKLGWVGF